MEGTINVAKKLVATRSVDIEVKGYEGKSAIILAQENGRMDIAELLAQVIDDAVAGTSKTGDLKKEAEPNAKPNAEPNGDPIKLQAKIKLVVVGKAVPEKRSKMEEDTAEEQSAVEHDARANEKKTPCEH